MNAEKAYVSALRKQVQNCFPEGTSLKCAKGDALYFVRMQVNAASPETETALNALGFTIKDSPNGLLLCPNAQMVLDFEQTHAPVDFFTQSLERFRNTPVSEAGLRLFTEGLQLIEQPEASRIQTYIRKVREAAAVALRTQKGGGIYASARISASL